jgi:hypothetical protein
MVVFIAQEARTSMLRWLVGWLVGCCYSIIIGILLSDYMVYYHGGTIIIVISLQKSTEVQKYSIRVIPARGNVLDTRMMMNDE